MMQPDADTTEPNYAVHDLYMLLRTELQRRNITEGAIEYNSSDDEDDHEWFAYRYEPDDTHELNVQLYCDNFSDSLSMIIGPAVIDIPLPDLKKQLNKIVSQAVDAIQMCLNGQLAVVMTVRKKDSQWQAAEIVWRNARGAQKTICVIPHYMFWQPEMVAVVLRNHQQYDAVSMSEKHFLYPMKIHGKAIVGRDINLQAPTPLTQAMYNDYDTALTVQAIGGEQGEQLWEVFYRRMGQAMGITCSTAAAT